MDGLFSDRITDVPRSFIREILKIALDPSVISFAGGLPDRDLFPVDEIKEATNKIFGIHGKEIFQYGNSEGYLNLREYIAQHYRQKKNLNVSVEDILITSGSQQALDLLGKVFLNEGDAVIIEEPGYLGAIQSFSIYRPKFIPIQVSDRGIDVQRLRETISSNKAKLIYTAPNFQNPSGISYSQEIRIEVAEILQRTNTILIEDDAYGDLRFSGKAKHYFKELMPDSTVLLGSFSKTIVPGFRLGWIAAPQSIMEKLIVAKQASDLHTSHFTQSIIYQYLRDNDINNHINKIITSYGNKCRTMLDSIQKYFPSDVTCTKPEGGMFLWAELPQGTTSLDLFDLAAKEDVIFVPGDPFYVNKTGVRTLRLNFSCADEATIQVGIRKLGVAITKLVKRV